MFFVFVLTGVKKILRAHTINRFNTIIDLSDVCVLSELGLRWIELMLSIWLLVMSLSLTYIS